VLRAFERLVDPYPQALPATPPASLLAFLWSCTRGMRLYIGSMTAFSALIAAFEAGLFALLGRIVDWFGVVKPDRLWAEQGMNLVWLALVLMASTGLVAMQSALKHQALAGNFPMLLRWNFHRLMLAQSMSFFGDEFAGRVAAKVMQTALAVRDA